jgi:hypothetical protein
MEGKFAVGVLRGGVFGEIRANVIDADLLRRYGHPQMAAVWQNVP